MSIASRLRAMSSAIVAGAKACVGIPTVRMKDMPRPENPLEYENEFFEYADPVAPVRTVGYPKLAWPDELRNVCTPRGHRSDKWLPTIDNAKHEYSTTASRREAQRKLDAERMLHVSVPVTEQDQFAAGWFGDRVWNNRIRASGTTYYKSAVL